MKKTTLLLALLLLIWTGLVSPLAGADEPVVRAVLFWSENCSHCHAVIAETLPPLQERYGSQLDVRIVEVSDPTRYELWLAAIETFQVPPERVAVPMLVIGDEGLVGEEVHARSLEALIARHTATGAEAVWEGREATQSEVASSISSIVERFRSFGLLTVLVAGLVDGLNPCAFATIVFFISYLAFVGRRRREVLAVGVAFTAGVFLTYLGVGAGLLRFLATLPFLSLGLFIHRRAAAIKLATAGLFVLLAGWLVTSLI
jgi:hypothetical protein